MKISIISVGKIKEDYLNIGIKEYIKRLKKYTDIEIVEISSQRILGNLSTDDILNKEKNKIEKNLPSNSFKISLSENGTKISSIEFAQRLNIIEKSGINKIFFIIGGHLGIHEEIIKNSNWNLSLSNMTFPYQIVRLILVEQLYRAFKINKSEPYHK